MLNFTAAEINSAFEKVNPKVREILNAEWVSEDIAILGKNLNLRIDKISELIKLVGYIFLRLIPLSKFIEHIENELEIDHEQAIMIAEKIDQTIFSKVRSEIFEMRGNIKPAEQKVVSSNFSPLDNSDALRESLLKEIEEHSEETENSNTMNEINSEENNQTMNKLKEVVSNDLTEKIVDPYREQI